MDTDQVIEKAVSLRSWQQAQKLADSLMAEGITRSVELIETNHQPNPITLIISCFSSQLELIERHISELA